MSKVIIIGGGSSALACAIVAARNKNEVTVIERNSSLGKKILATGNGHCNYFNEYFTKEKYHSSNEELLEKIITSDNKEKVKEFFQSIGIVPKIKEGLYYPISNQATTIKDLLVTELNKLNANIVLNEMVEDIEKENNKFKVKTNTKEYICDKVVIATGGMASPKTGSDGNGYSLIEKFNHSIVKPLPSLVQLIGKDKFYKDWSGIRINAKLKLLENKKLVSEETGELQLTDYGISGICSMQLSPIITRGLYNKKEEIVIINFLSELFQTEEDLYEYLTFRNNFLKNRTVNELLDGLLNYKLVNLLLKLSNIKKDLSWNELDEKEKKQLLNNIISFKVEIVDTKDFNNAQVTSGGVKLSEVNLKTFESKKEKGLFLIGEVLDIDGNCGGYNLGFAWLSGIIVGDNIR